MRMYRALYRTRTGSTRHMTFAHAGGHRAAFLHAQAWELRDDKLDRVNDLRECERPVFNLTSEVTA